MKRAIEHQVWLALMHQLPTRPPYLRVRIWRRLQAIGAVPLKNAVHVLPHEARCEEAFRSLLEDIQESGGEAVLAELRLMEGQGDDELQAVFDSARDADYAELARDARQFLERGEPSTSELAKLRRRLNDISSLDFFGAHGRQAAEAALRDLEAARHVHPDVRRSGPPVVLDLAALKGRTWVTRSGVRVDRMACAWLIRRFIDPEATFRFVAGNAEAPASGVLRFDMADAEYTHEGNLCSFEALLARALPGEDAGLTAIGEMIHDLDIGDGRYERPETAGLGAMLSGISASIEDDMERIEAAAAVFDQMYGHFSRMGDRPAGP